mgnify:CR=1 FL=1
MCQGGRGSSLSRVTGRLFDRVVAGAPDDFHVQRPSAHRRNGRERADSSQKESASKEKFSGRNRGFSIGDFQSKYFHL